jgi:hypothetical protein
MRTAIRLVNVTDDALQRAIGEPAFRELMRGLPPVAVLFAGEVRSGPRVE